MKRYFLITAAIVLILAGCARSKNPRIIDTAETDLTVYHEMSDGTWQADGRNYQYKLEITGKMHNASKDSTFVYLSNLESISFEQAWKAAGLSSNTDDYFTEDEAVLVEWR